MMFIYETGKDHPVAVIFPSGVEVSLDPWDVEEISEYGKFEYLWKGIQE